ncbi:MAG: LysR family transcriptional regulator [Clostridiales bacterium]|jgi:DNA-binding transcriptional LysR family regulator|nr:LysR family transcriptional regulator [Clostridiales bacterium]
MEINSLYAYCVVVESGSISKAAKKLFVSQPSLSVKIQELERYYHEKLLERTNKGIKPTAAGMIVYQHAQKILSLGENIERELDRSRGQEYELAVGASSTIGNYALPCTVYNFKERYPHINIQMDITNSKNVIEKLINRRVDLGLVEGPLCNETREALNTEKIKTKRVTLKELVLIVPNNEKWQNINGMLPDNQFRTMPLIIREKGSGIRTTLEMALAIRGITLDDLNVVLELNTINAIVSAVAAGKGVSILPRMAVRKELYYKMVKEVKVENFVFKHEFTTLFHAENVEKPNHAAFLNFLYSKDRGFC